MAASKKRRGAARPRLRALGRWALVLLALVVFGPVVLILPLRFIDPPATSLMIVRAVERARSGVSPAFPERAIVGLDRISPELRRAVLASEDDAFYLHHGFDFTQIERAVSTQSSRHRMRGASTISQQTAKNLFLWNGRSFIRKGLEAYLTVYLELLLPKDRLLELYLNLVESGEGLFGVESASRHYFKKPAIEVSAEEAARLASVLPNPRRFKPFGERAGERAARILQLMSRPTPRE